MPIVIVLFGSHFIGFVWHMFFIMDYSGIGKSPIEDSKTDGTWMDVVAEIIVLLCVVAAIIANNFSHVVPKGQLWILYLAASLSVARLPIVGFASEWAPFMSE